jgi:hypothetical protein
LVTERNYAMEMRALVDSETVGDYVAPLVAARIVSKLRASDPDLLRGWLDAGAETFVSQAINARDRSSRTRARAELARGEFGDAARAHDRGDATALDGWLHARFVVDDDLTRKSLASMRRPELVFVAERYEGSARESAFEAMFMRAMAKKVGNRTVGDVFTEEQLVRMRSSLVKVNAA